MNDELGHGHSIASWTGVGLLILGSTLVAAGIFFTWDWVTWSGVVICVLGVLAWVGLNAAGRGGPVSHASNTTSQHEHQDEHDGAAPDQDGQDRPGSDREAQHRAGRGRGATRLGSRDRSRH